MPVDTTPVFVTDPTEYGTHLDQRMQAGRTLTGVFPAFFWIVRSVTFTFSPEQTQPYAQPSFSLLLIRLPDILFVVFSQD